MKKLALLLITAVGLLSGCVAYEEPYHDRDHYRGEHHDRDHDGVPNAWDRRPDDPRRY